MVDLDDIARIAEQHGVGLLLLFGSSVTGRTHAQSDVDVGVLLEDDACGFERRTLERAIGRMIDINYHLITELNEAPPSDYFQSFTELGRLGVLPIEFARGLAASAGLRNRLVHQYDEIDPGRLYDAVQTAVRDIPLYLRAVDEFITAAAE